MSGYRYYRQFIGGDDECCYDSRLRLLRYRKGGFVLCDCFHLFRHWECFEEAPDWWFSDSGIDKPAIPDDDLGLKP